MKEIDLLIKAAREMSLFLWELKIKIKIMPQLTEEQKIYALCFRLL